MEKNEKINVLVLGASGAGKSTLIKAISGTEVMTGRGEGNTQKIDVYESLTWPIRLIDTKGFEYNLFQQWKTIHQVKKFTKEQIEDNINKEVSGVDVVWYCIEGTSGRSFSHNISLMNKAIKGWKNIPVFAVITKSYSKTEISSNIESVQQSFAKSNGVNLQKIIPVVAQEFKIDENITVPPIGIEELCVSTLDCFSEAREINTENKNRMILEQKRFTANSAVIGSTTTAVVVGAVPIPIPDSAILVPLETGLTKLIFNIYGIDYSGELVGGIVGSTILTAIAKQILKAIPIVGNVINGVVAGAIVFALGESVILASEAIYNGKLDMTKTNDVLLFISEKIKENPIIGATIEYFENNGDKLKNKSSKEIFNAILKSIKTK